LDLVALAVLAGLVLVIYFMRRQHPRYEATDTLKVTAQGLFLNTKEVSLDELWETYSKMRSPRRIDVVFDPDIAWGETWGLRDTLSRLARLHPNLTITGLEY